MKTIDLNCDVGEGVGLEAEILPLVSSANIACGAHAGDHETMVSVLRLAEQLGVCPGAHPGFADRENFGRLELMLSAPEIHSLVTKQLVALAQVGAFCYVKPHGALYNMAARDEAVAESVVSAVKDFDPSLWMMGLAGSVLLRGADRAGLTVVGEAFADRRYDEPGRLVSRTEPDAVIESQEEAVAQGLEIVRNRRVKSRLGHWVEVDAQSICIHGDNPHAPQFARSLCEAFSATDIVVQPFWHSV